MRPLLLALGVVLLPLQVASAQDFVPFEPTTPPPPAGEEVPAKEAAPAPAPAPETEASAEDELPELVPPAPTEALPDPGPETPEPAAGTAAETELEDGRRVVGEELVDEKVEPIGASAMAPATYQNKIATRSNERQAPSAGGAIGLATLRTARVGAPGSIRLALTGEFFLLDDFLIVGDRESRTAATFAVAWSPTEWLEAYATIAYASTTNTLSSPTLLQIQGDSTVGVKGAYVMDNGFALGLDLELSLFPPIGEVGIGAAGFSPRLLAAYDFRAVEENLPLIVHLESGFAFDGTGTLPGRGVRPGDPPLQPLPDGGRPRVSPPLGHALRRLADGSPPGRGRAPRGQ